MNRRKDVSEIRVRKRNRKEVKSSMKTETPVPKKPVPAVKKISVPTPKKRKKISKRTSKRESIEKSAPAHSHKEGARWIEASRKKTADKKIVLLKTGAKISR